MSYLPVFEIDNLGIATEPTPASLKTNTRTSTATAFDHEGVLVTGEPYEIMLKGGRRVHNPVANSEGAGGVNGVIGSGGALPTGWSAPFSAGLDVTVVDANATVDGMSGVTLKVNGTANTTGFFRMQVCSTTTIDVGLDIIASQHFALVGGAAPSSLHLNVVNVGDNIPLSALTSSIDRYAGYGSVASPAVRLEIRFSAVNLQAEDFTVFIARVHLQDVSGRSDLTTPDSYIDSETDHGYGVNGVKWYDTTNGNFVVDNIVTEAPGAAISPAPEVQMLPARTNAVVNNTFSEIASATNFDAWAESVNGTSTVTQETIDLPAGFTTGLRIDTDGSNSLVGVSQTRRLAVGVGGIAVLSAQVKSNSSTGIMFSVRADDGAGGSLQYLSEDGSAWQSGIAYFKPPDLPTSWAKWEFTLPATDAGRTDAYCYSVTRNEGASSSKRITGLQLEPGLKATPTIITTTAAVARAKDEIQIADFDTWANATEGVIVLAVTPSDDWAVSSTAYFMSSGDLFFYRNDTTDGLISYDGVSSSQVISGNTPNEEILASVIYSATLGQFVIGYSQDGGVTFDWDATPQVFTSYTFNSILKLGKFIPESYTMRGATMFDGLPPGSDATLGDVQDWVEGIAPLWPYIPSSSGVSIIGNIIVPIIRPIINPIIT